MHSQTKEYLLRMGQQEKRFDALYRSAASAFGFPDCSMWILYFLAMEGKSLAQHELIDRMMFPKQTIHSAVAWLARQGWVSLETNPASRRSKNILLTDAGRKVTQDTVGKVLSAEAQAVEHMGKEKMDQYIALHEELLRLLRLSFAEEQLIDTPDAQLNSK